MKNSEDISKMERDQASISSKINKKAPFLICKNRKCLSYEEILKLAEKEDDSAEVSTNSEHSVDQISDKENNSLIADKSLPVLLGKNIDNGITKINWSLMYSHQSGTKEKINLIPAGAPVAFMNLPKVCQVKSTGGRPPKNSENYGNKFGQATSSGRGRIIGMREQCQRNKDDDLRSWNSITTTTRKSTLRAIRDKVLAKDAEKKPKEDEIKDISAAKCSCEDCDSFSTCSLWLKRNTDFPEVDVNGGRKGSQFLNFESDKKEEKIDKIITKNLVLYGTFIPKPLASMKDSYFKEGIECALKELKISLPNEAQSYIWLAVIRRLNVFLVAPAKSGKTLAYLPGLCAIVADLSDTYDGLSNYNGPLIIIFAHNENKCEIIRKSVQGMLKHALKDEQDNINDNRDILVTTPKDFEACLKSESLDLRRLFHVVLEDGDILLKAHQNMGKFLKIFDRIQEQRAYNKNFQIIVTAENWTRDLELLAKNIHLTPLICFGNYFEAAFFSHVVFTKRTFKRAIKRTYLEDLLTGHYTIKKAIVFCKHENIDELSEYLRMRGLENFKMAKGMDLEIIAEHEDIWASFSVGHHKVLIISDEMFAKSRQLVNADWLIHFDLPSDTNTFINRFKSISWNLKWPLAEDFDSKGNCVVHVIYESENKDDAISDLIALGTTRNIVSHVRL